MGSRMVSRTIYIGRKAFLSTRHSQLVIRIDNDEQSIPIEDIGVLELDSSQISISVPCLNALSESNVAIITCGNNHLPAALTLPLSSHSTHTERLRPQLEASLPLRKQIWQSTIKAKLQNQADALESVGIDSKRITAKISKVRSGDPTNQEGIAAAYYWKVFFNNSPIVPKPFFRDPSGEFPNNALNYGYAILRAMVARGLVSTGLHPSIGLFHRNKYNPFCLADDVMEPFRPFVDIVVYLLIRNVEEPFYELTSKHKKFLLGIGSMDSLLRNEISPIMIAVQRCCSSLWQVLAGESSTIIYPRLCHIDLLATEGNPSQTNAS